VGVTGLWLLQECMRYWDASGAATGSLESLCASAALLPPLRHVIDADDPVFLPPGDMPSRIAAWLTSRGRPAPSDPAQTVRCVLDSLALAYRQALRDAQSLSGRHVDVVHIVGGGSRNELLCQLTADATGLPVVAGPAGGPRSGTSSCRPARSGRLRHPSTTCARSSGRWCPCGSISAREIRAHGSRPRTEPQVDSQSASVILTRSNLHLRLSLISRESGNRACQHP
jgi:hypothetical protein